MATTPESTDSKKNKTEFFPRFVDLERCRLALVLYLRCPTPQLALRPRFDNGTGIIPTLK